MKGKLYRSRKEKMIAGVAGGLAEYFEVDPVLIRISFVAATFISGIGIVAYILLWIIVPENPEVFYTSPDIAGAAANTAQASIPHIEKKHKGVSVIGIVLIIMGILFLADNLFPFINFDNFWPLILIGLGIGLLLKSYNKN